MNRATVRGTGRAALLAIAVAVLPAAKCPWQKAGALKPATASAAVIPDSADQVMHGVTTYMQDRGISKGELLSDTAYVYDDGNRLEFRRVNLTFRTPQGAKDGVLTSKTGNYNARLSRLEARGEVIVTQESGRRLTTPQLVYDQARNQIFSDSAFTLNEPTRQLTGIGFETDPKLMNFNCLRACKAVAPVAVPVR